MKTTFKKVCTTAGGGSDYAVVVDGIEIGVASKVPPNPSWWACTPNDTAAVACRTRAETVDVLLELYTAPRRAA